MAKKVGAKGQIVISREARERLGIKPGWQVIETIVGNHLELRFVPPEHRDSLFGSLAKYVTKSIETEEDWDRAREAAWESMAREKMSHLDDEP